MAIDVGDVHRLTYNNLDANGNLASAGAMALTITLPDATTTTVTPVSPVSTGVYRHDYQTVQAGRHTVRWVGTGANPSAHSDVFDVRPASLAYIVSLADAKQHLNIPALETEGDEELRVFIESATQVVERHRREVIARRTVVEYQRVCYTRLLLQSVPVISLTSVETVDATTTWNVNNLHLDPDMGVVTVKTGPMLSGYLKLTYVAGQTNIPANYILAARIIVAHLWETQRGSAGAPRIGEDRVMVGTTVATFSIPRRAIELLGDSRPLVG